MADAEGSHNRESSRGTPAAVEKPLLTPLDALTWFADVGWTIIILGPGS